jgi:hypothetical protein
MGISVTGRADAANDGTKAPYHGNLVAVTEAIARRRGWKKTGILNRRKTERTEKSKKRTSVFPLLSIQTNPRVDFQWVATI